MGIAVAHFAYHKAILGLPGFVSEPIRIMGVQEFFGTPSDPPDAIWPDFVRDGGHTPTLRDYFLSRGHRDVLEIDHQDHRAGLLWDLNLPIPEAWHDTAGMIYDAGTIEHVADSCRVLENYLRLARTGGHIMIHTPVKGFFGHGLHTFSPEFIVEGLKANGCEVRYLKYSTDGQAEVQVTMDAHGRWTYPAAEHVLLWVVVQKVRPTGTFQVIQQKYYG